MKKHITIAALLVAGTAFANAATEELLWELDLGGTAPADQIGVTGGLALSEWAGVKCDGSSEPVEVTYLDKGSFGADSLVANYLINDSTKYVEYTFTLTNTLDTSLTLTEFSFNAFAANANGHGQGSDRTGVYTLTVGDRAYNSGNINLPSNSGTTLVSSLVSFALTDTIIAAGGYVDITLNMKKPSGNQYYTGLASLSAKGQYEVVPEPSAFGLLAGIGALALVASRRRRK